MSSYTGTGALTRFALRRDRILAPAWIAVFTLTVASSASATVGLYPNDRSRLEAAATVNDVPALVALYGRIWDPTSLGALSIMKLGAFGGALVAILAIVLVVRHSRAEEEKGRLELVGATVVGRRAALSAALLIAMGTILALGVLTAVAAIATGLPSSGSWAFGLSWASVGLVFAAVAAVTAQVTVSARTAVGSAVAVVGVAYVLRAVGDTVGSTSEPGLATWLSPIGWAQQIRPFAGDRWWVLVLPVVATVVLVGSAYVLASHRDLGAGLLPDRAGRATASSWLSSPLGLAWRLQRGLLIGWLAAYLVLGLVFGTIATEIGGLLDSEQAREFIRRLGGAQAITDAFLAAELGIMAFITAAYGISAAMRLHSEEEDGHAELLLTTATARIRWLASHVTIALLGTTALSLTAGLASGTAYAAKVDNASAVWAVLGGVTVHLPAVWMITGLTVLLFGFLPRWIALAWVALVGFLLVGEFGVLLSLPQWVLDLSPFSHVPRLPGGTMTWTPVVVLLLVSAALLVAGAVGFRRRDLDTP